MSAARLMPMVGAVAALAVGVLGGLARAGAPVPAPPGAAADHGALMVAGFLGTLIAVERAVALDRAWGWSAPALSALGALALVAGHGDIAAPLLVAGAAGLVATTLATAARQPSDFGAVLAAGALALAIANALWWSGQPVFTLVPWWVAFLVFTIAGERLELSRLAPRGPAARGLFAAIGALYVAGLVGTLADPATGVQVIGVAQVALAGWLVQYDIARRTIRTPGLPRYIAWALLSGYVWLAIGGTLAIVAAGTPAGLLYDAMLHSVLVGFVLAMIFGHAPIVLPAVLGIRSPWHPTMYAPLAVLHVTVGIRVAGDLAGLATLRTLGSVGHVLALVLFALAAATGLRASRPSAA